MRRLGGSVSCATEISDDSSAMTDPRADDEGNGAGLSRQIGRGSYSEGAKARRGREAATADVLYGRLRPAEIRSPKAEGRRKSEIRRPNWGRFSPSPVPP